MSTSAADAATDIRPLPKAWLIVAVLWVVGCLNYLDRVLLTTMRDSIKAAIPMGDGDFGLLTTAFLISYGVLSPLGGWCADRFNRSRVILASLVAWSAATLATAYAQSYEQLLITRGASPRLVWKGDVVRLWDLGRGDYTDVRILAIPRIEIVKVKVDYSGFSSECTYAGIRIFESAAMPSTPDTTFFTADSTEGTADMTI